MNISRLAELALVDSAIQFARQGIKVLPIRPNEKVPLTIPELGFTNGYKTATTYEGLIRSAWEKYPTANIGLVVGYESNLFVIDVDSHDGRDGLQGLRECEGLYGKLPDTRVHASPHGLHYLFYFPEALRDEPVKSAYVSGVVDIKGKSGYVLAPPSIVNGSSYRVMEDGERTELSDSWISGAIDKRPKIAWGKVEHSGTTLCEEYNLRLSDFLDTPPNAKSTAEGYQGSHPLHGSNNGKNFAVNTSKGLWYCFRCNTGGDALQYYALKKGFFPSCENVGRLEGDLFKRVKAELRRDGYIPDESKTISDATFKAVFAELENVNRSSAGASVLLSPGQHSQRCEASSSELNKFKKSKTKHLIAQKYWELEDGLYWIRSEKTNSENGLPYEVVKKRLSNFDARITADVARDDGLEIERSYVINGLLLPSCEKLPTREIAVDDFASMRWAYSWDVRAVVEPQNFVKDNLRAAIQERSSDSFERKVIYTHIGWREVDGKRVYLHAGGAIGCDISPSVELEGKLHNYCLPKPDESRLKEDVSLTLNLLAGIATTLGYVHFGAAVRPILNESKQAESTLFDHGEHATFKTNFCAIWQAFYGQDFRADSLPIGWNSTALAIERLKYVVKDALLLVDDYRPPTNQREQNKLEASADTVIRGQANNSPRQRLNQNAKAGRTYPPRCGLISTGEIPPAGQSLRGRTILCKIKKGDIPKKWLDVAQYHAARGVYARVTSSFIEWLSPRIKNLKMENAENHWRDVLAQSLGTSAYGRTAANLAEYYVGFRFFIAFALQKGALGKELASKLLEECKNALISLGKMQEGYIMQEEPTELFIEMLRGALGGGYACIANASDRGKLEKGTSGSLIGFYDDETQKFLLDGTVTYEAVRNFAVRSGVHIGRPSDVWAALGDKGYLTSELVDGKTHYSVRRRVKALGDKQKRFRELEAAIVGE